MNRKYQKGLSLLEILVVIAIFSILGILVTRSVLLTLRGSKKSESLYKTRENLSYATSVIERHIRNAEVISSCPFSGSSLINYVDKNGVIGSFSCLDIDTDGYIASASARITSEDVDITSCSFSCESDNSINPPIVSISVVGQDKNATGIENSQVSISTQIQLRSY